MKNFFNENKHNSDIQERYKNISDFLRNNLKLCLQFVFISLNGFGSLSETFKFQYFLHLQETTSKRVFCHLAFQQVSNAFKSCQPSCYFERRKNNQSVFSGLFPIKLCCQSMLILQCTILSHSCSFHLKIFSNKVKSW